MVDIFICAFKNVVEKYFFALIMDIEDITKECSEEGW